MSVRAKVTTPAGSTLSRRHDAPEEIVRGGRAPDRVGIERTPQDAVQPLRELGRDAFPLDLGPGAGPPGERVDDRRRQPEHVGRRARLHAVSQLGGAMRVDAVGARDPRAATPYTSRAWPSGG